MPLNPGLNIVDIWKSIAVFFWGKVYPYLHTFKKEILRAFYNMYISSAIDSEMCVKDALFHSKICFIITPSKMSSYF